MTLAAVHSGGLAPALTSLRLSLHVLAAAVFVGGQLTMAGLLGVLRPLGRDATRAAARAFARVQWPAYALLLLTGIWNGFATDPGSRPHSWQVVFGVKVAVALLAGAAAYAHSRSRSTLGLALFGALSALGALGAMVLGVLLAG